MSVMSNPVYVQSARHAGSRSRGRLNPDEFSGYWEPDWLFFSEDLSAYDAPGNPGNKIPQIGEWPP